jgi:hypothetical protein
MEWKGFKRVILKTTDMTTLLDSGKKIVCFGAGKILKGCCERYRHLDFWAHIYRIIDNNATQFELEENVLPVYKPERFVKEQNDLKDVVLLITCNAYFEVFEQLQRIPQLNDVECYIHSFFPHRPPPYEFPKPKLGAVQKIPKKIHYFWVGGSEIPKKNRIWMESWEKHCPDYEIIRWDESNYDFAQHPYIHDAYKEKRWAFVSDYARLDIIYQHGGIYLDTDVEVLKNLDILLYDMAFCGFSSYRYVATGLGFGAVKGFPLIKKFMDHYDGVSFYNSDGSLNLDDNGVQQTTVLDKLGLNHDNTSWQLIDGMRIYPTDVLSPMDYQCNPTAYTKNTLTVHHFDASWFDNDAMRIRNNTLQRNREFWSKYSKESVESQS